MSRNIKTLFKILKNNSHKLEQNNFGNYSKLLIQQSISAMFRQLFEDKIMTKYQMLKIANQILSTMKEDKQFRQYINKQFKLLQLKCLIIHQLGSDRQDILKILQYGKYQQFQDNVRLFLQQMRDSSKIADLNNQNNIIQLVQKIQKNENYVYLLKTFPSLKKQELQQREAYNKKQMKLKIQQMQNMLNDMQNSRIDQLIQANLILSFKSNLAQQTKTYTQQQYNTFKNQLKNIIYQYKQQSYQLDKVLQCALSKQQTYYDKIIQIRSKIHPIFVPQLTKLMNKTKNTKQLIRYKDTIVIMGPTGAGKSTLSQMILQYKLQQKQQNNGLYSLMPINGLKQKHKQFICKNQAKSVTSHVCAVKIQLPQKYQHLNQIYLTDTPGFFDTNGSTVEIVNALSTVNVLKFASSARFIFVFNYKSRGNRYEELKKVINIMANLFTEYDQIKEKVLFFLNQFTESEIQELPALMRDIKQNMNIQEKGNANFVSMISHLNYLFQKVRKQSVKQKISIKQYINKSCKQLYIMDPLHYNIQQLHQKIFDQDIKINRLNQILSNALTPFPQVKLKLINTAKNIQSLINICLDKSQYEMGLYYIKNLYELVKITQQSEEVGGVRANYNKILNKLKEDYEIYYRKFVNSMQQRVINLKINQETIKQIKEYQQKMVQLLKYYAEIPQMENVGQSMQINQIIANTSDALKQKLCQKYSHKVITTVILYSQQFDNSLKQYFVEHATLQINQIKQTIQDCLNLNNFPKLDLQLTNWKNISALLYEVPEFSNNIVSWRQKINNKISQIFNTFYGVINKLENQTNISQLSESDYNIIKQTVNIFMVTKNNFENQQLQIVCQYKKRILEQIKQMGQNYLSQISSLVESDGDQIFKNYNIQNIRIIKLNINKIISVNQVFMFLKQKLQSQQHKILKLIKRKMTILDNYLLMQSYSAINYLKSINEQIWNILSILDHQSKQKYKQKMRRYSQKIIIYFKNWINDIKNTKFTVGCSSKIIRENAQIYNQIVQVMYRVQNEQKFDTQEIKQKSIQQVQNIYIQFKKLIQLKNQQIVSIIQQSIQKYRKQIQQNLVKKENIREQTNNLIKIHYIFKQLNPKQIKDRDFYQKVLKLSKIYNKNIKQIAEMLKSQIFNQFKLIQQHIKNSQSQKTFTKQIINQIQRKLQNIRKLNIQIKIQNVRQFKMIQNISAVFNNIQNQISQKIDDIQSLIHQNFDKNIQNNTNLSHCKKIMKICSFLKHLDSKITLNAKKFKQISTQLEDSFNSKLPQQKFNSQNVIKQGQIDVMIFKSVYKYRMNFSQDSQQRTQLYQCIAMIKQVIQKQESKLIQKIIILSHFSPTNFMNQCVQIYQQLLQILTKINQLNNVIQIENQKIQLQQNTVQKIAKMTKNIISKYVKLIEGCLDKGSQGYSEAEKYIQFLTNIQTYCEQLSEQACKNQLKLREQLKKFDSHSIHKYWREQMRIQKNKLQKYKQKSIGIQDLKNLKKQYGKFGQKQKEQIRQNVQNCFQQQIQQLSESIYMSINQSKLKNKSSIIEQQINYLPRPIKNYVQQQFKQKKKEIEKQYRQLKQYVKNSYNFLQCCHLVRKQENNKIKNMYVSYAQEQFKKQILQLQKQENCQNIIKILTYLFINTIKDINIQDQRVSVYKKIYQEYVNKAIEYIQNSYLVKKFQKTQAILQGREYIKNNEDKCNQIKYLVISLKVVIQFLLNNKKTFINFQEQKYLQRFVKLFLRRIQALEDQDLAIQTNQIIEKGQNFLKWYYQTQVLQNYLNSIKSQNLKFKQIQQKMEQKMIKIRNKIQQINKNIQSTDISSLKLKSYKTIIAVSATNPMKNILSGMPTIISKLMKNVEQKPKNIITYPHQIQIILYRDYNALQYTMQSSPFTNNVIQLQTFLEQKQISGQTENQALECVFNSINKQQNISQIIVIGNAPPNTPTQIMHKQSNNSEYWDNKDNPTYNAQIQVKKLKARKIPIHTLYIASDSYFQNLSKQTNGISQKLNANDPKIEQKVAQFMTERILQKITINKQQIIQIKQSHKLKHQ